MKKSSSCACCSIWLLFFAGFAGVIASIYFLAPGRTNLLILGLDYSDPWNSTARTDSILLGTFIPSEPYLGVLSIPRDLWVNIPGVGENRINTAHFFAEASQPGSGPTATIETIKNNFGVDIDYYIRVKFEGFKELFNAFGGVDIDLPAPMGGYEAGRHHLTANKALAFSRNRTGADDFTRMLQGQFIIKAALKQVILPINWPKLPSVGSAFLRAIDTNVPIILWPRFGLALLRIGPDKIDNRMITREMVTPFTTDQGASVLSPNWNLINPLLMEMFGQ